MAASVLTTILHELTHAIVAYVLGVPATLYSYFANLDLTAAALSPSRRVCISVSGPVFCLGLGMVAWLVFRRARDSAAQLPLLFFAVFGMGTFFGNLMSISFGGDFSSAAAVLSVPTEVRYAITVIGALSVAVIHFWAGRELAPWVPAGAGRLSGVVGIIALPVIVGTAAVIVVNQPMPRAFTAVRLGEASFWLFAAIGSWTGIGHSPRSRRDLRVRWADALAFLLAVLVVRVLVRGIPLT